MIGCIKWGRAWEDTHQNCMMDLEREFLQCIGSWGSGTSSSTVANGRGIEHLDTFPDKLELCNLLDTLI